MIKEKDSENKRFLVTLAGMATLVVGTVSIIVSSTLGGNTKIETSEMEELEDELE